MGLEDISFWWKLLILSCLVLVMTWIVYEITRQQLTPRRKLKISLAGAVILALYTQFFLGGHSVLFSEEGLIAVKTDRASVWLNNKISGHSIEEADYDFFKKRFIFISTSATNQLVDTGQQGDATSIVITHREKLTGLFKLLCSYRKKIAYAACDLTFIDATENDDSLLNYMKPLQNSGQLVLASGEGFAEDNNNFYRQINPQALGDVANEKNEEIIYSFTPVSEDRQQLQLSFPYAMYVRTDSTDYHTESETYIMNRNFIPHFAVADENKLFAHAIELGTLTGSIESQKFLNLIDTFNAKGYRPVIFIGNFRSDYTDLHQTVFGRLHGVAIVCNQFYALHNKEHFMSKGKLLLYIFFLLASFFGILYLMLTRAGLKDLRSNKRILRQKEGKVSYFAEWLESVLPFIINESYFVLLFVLALLINIIFDKLINIMGLIYVVPLFGILLKYYIKQGNVELTTVHLRRNKTVKKKY